MVVALWVKPWTWLTSIPASLFMVGDAYKGSSMGKNVAAKSMVVSNININGFKCSWEVDGIEVIDGGGGGGIVEGIGCDIGGIWEVDGMDCEGIGRGLKMGLVSTVVVGRGSKIGVVS